MSAQNAIDPPERLAVRLGRFFRCRWRGETPLPLVFWRDTLVVGTAINIASTIAGVLLLGAGVPAALAIGVHFAPLPYNIFLLVAVCRAADRQPGIVGHLAQIITLIWLAVVTLV